MRPVTDTSRRRSRATASGEPKSEARGLHRDKYRTARVIRRLEAAAGPASDCQPCVRWRARFDLRFCVHTQARKRSRTIPAKSFTSAFGFSAPQYSLGNELLQLHSARPSISIAAGGRIASSRIELMAKHLSGLQYCAAELQKLLDVVPANGSTMRNPSDGSRSR